MMRDSSEDFFSQNTSPPGAVATSIRSRRPPPGGKADRSAGSGATSRGRGPPPPPPPKASLSMGTAGNSTSAYSSASRTTSQQRPPPPARPVATSNSYHGTNASAAPAAPSLYSTSASSSSATTTSASSSYYGAPAAAPAPTPQAASDWYTPSAFAAAPYPSASTEQEPFLQSNQPQQPHVMNPYMTSSSNPSLEGTMDTKAPAIPRQTPHATKRSSSFGLNLFGSKETNSVPPAAPTSSGSYYAPYDPLEFADEPPLLEELGIITENIWFKTKAVLFPLLQFKNTSEKYQSVPEIVQDNDLAGPLAFALALGGELLLSGKIHFGYIYGFGVFGCWSMTLVLNLMSPVDAVSIWTVASILGYSLLPVNILACVKLLLLGYLENVGRILALFTILWCTVASTRLLEQGCGMRDQRYLVAYPIALLYSAFVMITIF